MKYIILVFLSAYQILVSPLIHAITGTKNACRYPVTCSEYAKQVIAKYGVGKGGVLAIKRISSCHPFARYHSVSG